MILFIYCEFFSAYFCRYKDMGNGVNPELHRVGKLKYQSSAVLKMIHCTNDLLNNRPIVVYLRLTPTIVSNYNHKVHLVID